MIGVAVLGCGFMGKTHLAVWKMMDECRVVGIWSRNRKTLMETAAHYGVEPFTEFDNILKDDRIDVVDICTPTFTHAEFAVRALEAGKHVLVEKPIALNISDADKMINAANKNSRLLMVAHVLRFFSDYMKMKELVDAGALGEIVSLRAWRGGPAPDWSPWFMNLEESGGVAVDLAIHDVDYAIWVNESTPIRVYAKVGNLKHKKYNIHDFALINLRFPSGSIAVIEANWALPKNYPFTMRLEIVGTRGVATLDNQSSIPLKLWTDNNIEIFAPESLPWRPGVHPFPLDPFYREIRHFVECIKYDKKPMTNGEEAKKSLAVCLAAIESAQKGLPVNMGW